MKILEIVDNAWKIHKDLMEIPEKMRAERKDMMMAVVGSIESLLSAVNKESIVDQAALARAFALLPLHLAYLGRFEEANICLAKGLDFFPNDPAIKNTSILLAMYLKDWEAAFYAGEDAISLAEEAILKARLAKANATRNKAIATYELHKYMDAMKTLNEAITQWEGLKMDGRDVDSHLKGAYALRNRWESEMVGLV